jgi:hypothetical protein
MIARQIAGAFPRLSVVKIEAMARPEPMPRLSPGLLFA